MFHQVALWSDFWTGDVRLICQYRLRHRDPADRAGGLAAPALRIRDPEATPAPPERDATTHARALCAAAVTGPETHCLSSDDVFTGAETGPPAIRSEPPGAPSQRRA
jgi:hypothetical protein